MVTPASSLQTHVFVNAMIDVRNLHRWATEDCDQCEGLGYTKRVSLHGPEWVAFVCNCSVLDNITKLLNDKPIIITDNQRVSFDPFDGDRDVDIRMSSVKIVTTRTIHSCTSPIQGLHEMKIGTRARYEKAIMDDEWVSYWTCIDCIDAFINEYGV